MARAPEPEAAGGEDHRNEGEDGDAGGEGEAGSGARGTPGVAASGSGPGTGEPPAYPGTGFRRPAQARRFCVQDSLKIPSSLQGFASGPITVKFAIGPDGVPDSFEVMGPVPDSHVAAAIWQAIQSCKWIAGSDAQGRPARLWIVMPIRFQPG
jgi:protein TonB